MGPAGAGGRVAAVAGTDRDPLLYYFGAAGGGVFKTTNGGLTWNDVWPRGAAGAIGAVAIAPSDDRTVWVGTGESTPRNDASYGDGVWVTRDGGAHWKRTGLEDTYAISRIAVDPRNPNAVLAGAFGDPFGDSIARGVYRTVDGGRVWQRTLYAGPQSGISDLVRDPVHPDVAYAGVYQFRRKPWTFSSGGPQDGIYKTTDDGRTWTRLRTGLPPGPMGRIGLAVAASKPSRIYALVQSKSGLLWRSDDSGSHWRRISGDTLIDQRPFYMSRLEVDPRNASHVYFSSENLVQTHDGGKTFQDIASAVHQDHHGLWISRDGRRLIEADDGGAPISVDGGVTWDWRFNVPLAQIYHVGYDRQTPYRLCAAMQDDDSFCAPSLSLSPLGLLNDAWRDVANDADGVAVWPEPGNPDAIWNVGINELNGQLGIYDMRSRQNYDVTPDVTDTNGRPLAGLTYRFNWEAPLAFAPLEPGTAYFGANVVFETRDRGRTWTTISPDLTRNDASKQQLAGGPINTDISGAEFYDTLLEIAPSPLDRNVIWAGTDDGLIQRTDDRGAHWANVTPAWIGPWGRVEAIAPSSGTVDRAYAVVDRHLMGDRRPYVIVTNNGGRTWNLIVRGLPAMDPARVVREDPKNPDVLFAGTERGVWLSLDRGETWRSWQMNMPSVSVHDLRVQPDAGDLIVGSHGRGAFIFDDLAPIEGLASARQGATPVLFPIRPAYAWYYWWVSQYGTSDTECCAPAGTFSAEDPPYGALMSYYLPARSAQRPWIEIDDANGRIVRRVDGTNDAGLNRVAWNLTEEPPARWFDTGTWNQGPSDGPAVVPGTYRARLHAERTIVEGAIEVRADPRATWTTDDYLARHDFVKTLDDELSDVDDALNRLDALRAHAKPARKARIDSLIREFTSGVRNSEDDQWMPDRLRERITILQGTVALSQGPPLAAHQREASAIRRQYDAAMARYRAFLEDPR